MCELKEIEIMRNKATELVKKKDYQNALLVITCMAEVLYQYNQEYVDLDLEGKLSEIQQALDDQETIGTKEFSRNKKDKIVFYDGFGLDVRGLALIYLQALVKTKYRIIYVVREKQKDAIPTIKTLLEQFNAEIIYIPQLSLIDEYRYLVSVMDEVRPYAGLLYTTPNDVSGVMAFVHEQGQFIRYQINLTDDAFWLGRNAFDYCIEFRDYGAGVSHYYRDIPQDKIIKLPYYPYIDEAKEFEGFPFMVAEDELILFSGGALYKTFDGKDNFYYQMVDTILKDYKKIKFWYAGQGDDRELVRLMKRYPDRVFHTAERKDLFQIMAHVDLYLDTYPVGGGLMIQYAAAAGKIPLSLRRGEESGGVIEQREVLFEFDSFEELHNEIEKLIFDRLYREKQGEKIKNSIVTEKQFQSALEKIVTSQSSPYAVSYRKPNVDTFRKIYYERFEKSDVHKIIARPQYFGLMKFFPTCFADGLVIKGDGDFSRDIQVSVIICTYNQPWQKLRKSLVSVLRQKNIKLEILVADDGSCDNHFDKIVALFNRYCFSDYILFPAEKNRGTCINLYRALINTRGKYGKGLSPGDYLYDESTLVDFYNFAEKNKADICFGNAIYYSDDEQGYQTYRLRTNPRNMRIYDKAYSTLDEKKKKLRFHYLLMNDFICGVSFFYKTEVGIQYCERIVGKVKYAEDNMFRLMVLEGIDFLHYDRNITWYEYGTGISTPKNNKWVECLAKDLDAANKCMIQCQRFAEWFPRRYQWLLGAKQRWLRYILFPQTILARFYARLFPVYTKQEQPTLFYWKL